MHFDKFIQRRANKKVLVPCTLHNVCSVQSKMWASLYSSHHRFSSIESCMKCNIVNLMNILNWIIALNEVSWCIQMTYVLRYVSMWICEYLLTFQQIMYDGTVVQSSLLFLLLIIFCVLLVWFLFIRHDVECWIYSVN